MFTYYGAVFYRTRKYVVRRPGATNQPGLGLAPDYRAAKGRALAAGSNLHPARSATFRSPSGAHSRHDPPDCARCFELPDGFPATLSRRQPKHWYPNQW